MTFRPSPARTSEHGSILFYILIAVVVFAALTYAVASSLRGNSNISKEQLTIGASDIISSGNRLVEAVTRLRLRDVPKTSLSFQNGTVAGYNNGDCSVGSCKIFDGAGGGLTWETPPPGSQTTTHNWAFTATRAITNVGTSSGELIAMLPNLTLEMCNQINNLLSANPGSSVPPVVANMTLVTKFGGNFPGVVGTLNHPTINGKKAICIQVSNATGAAFTGAPLTNTYMYLQVLLAQ